MPIEHERGFLIIAQDTEHVSYLRCARVLARSIRRAMPSAKICLLTNEIPDYHADFDMVKIFPFGDQSGASTWKLHNDWQCFYASPFRQTIKIEADMLVPCSIEHWFDLCQHRDVVVAKGARTWRGWPGTSRYYRKVFDHNDLPDVYNAMTYWRYSRTAEVFFSTVRAIMQDWPAVMGELRFAQDQPVNTDLAYAIAVRVLGEEQHTLPLDLPGFTHMKSRFNDLASDDWRQELIWEAVDGEFRINTVSQLWPCHYHEKTFAAELEEHYGPSTG